MNLLFDPIGFLADSIAIANALGFYTKAQKEQAERIQIAIEETHGEIEDLADYIESSQEDLKSLIYTASVVEVRSRLQINDIPSDKIDLLIRLLLLIKQYRGIVCALIVKFKVRNRDATLGFAGSSSDAIEHMCGQMDRFYRGLSQVKTAKTAYVNVRIRGKSDTVVENQCSAALMAVATEVCKLSHTVDLASVENCAIEANDERTLVLLRPESYEYERTECDRIRRVFLIGDTRSGKSTLGNAMLGESRFVVSKGMTGTMKVERGERVEAVDNTVWMTEIFDTPGLNDKDGLDVFYQAAIEDQIRILQRASAFVMTVNVDAGITEATFTSLAAYKELFGESIASMLMIVLTSNEPADEGALDDLQEFNWPTISGLDHAIAKKNVFCLSLHDLRENQQSVSHKIVENIARACRNMELRMIESLSRRYNDIRQSLLARSLSANRQVQELMNDGWQAYESLARQYEGSKYVKMTTEEDGMLDGFVMKHASIKRRLVTVLSGGLVNCVRKVAITVVTVGSNAQRAWQEMIKTYSHERSHANLMWEFGDVVDRYDLGFCVQDKNIYHFGTLRVKPYTVTVFDPVTWAHDELAAHLKKMMADHREEFVPEVMCELLKLALPASVRFARQWSKKLKISACQKEGRKRRENEYCNLDSTWKLHEKRCTRVLLSRPVDSVMHLGSKPSTLISFSIFRN